MRIILTESQFNRVILKELIKEQISPRVWHFCDFGAISSILRQNKLRFHRGEFYKPQYRANNMGIHGGSERTPYYFCTTRSKNSFEGYSRLISLDNLDGGFARIQLNGDALNNIARGKASNYYGSRDKEYPSKSILYKEIERGKYSGQKISDIYNNIQSLDMNEKEDTIWYRKEYLENASKYIERVDIFVSSEDNVDENKVLCQNMKRNAEKWNIPIFFYDNIREFNKQGKNILIT